MVTSSISRPLPARSGCAGSSSVALMRNRSVSVWYSGSSAGVAS